MCDGAEPETEARRRSYFHFALCNEEDGAGNELPVAGLGRQQDFIPLNWALSTPASDFIAPPRPAAGRPSAMDHCGNAEELRELRSRLQGGRPLVSR
jgi:hypothetical protein